MTKPERQIATSVLVIGTGGAGLRAAIELAVLAGGRIRDPERMELSTRDRVALAAYTEIKEGRGTPHGGVWVRPEDHATGVDRLYAIGEASSGLHGANRLGGNSLIELPEAPTTRPKKAPARRS